MPEHAIEGIRKERTLSHPEVINNICWSPDGRALAAALKSGDVFVWNVAAGRRALHIAGPSTVNAVAWSPDGWSIACACKDGRIQIWDANTGRPRSTLQGHEQEVNDVAWSYDGSMLASASDDGTVLVWDVRSKWIFKSLIGHSHVVNEVAWFQGNREIASGSDDGTVRIWDLQTSTQTQTLSTARAGVMSVAVSARDLISAGCTDGSVRLWDRRQNFSSRILEGHQQAVASVTFASSGEFLASESWDDTVRIWSASEYRQVGFIDGLNRDLGVFGGIGFADADANSSLLATVGDRDRILTIWRIDHNDLRALSRLTDTVEYSNAKVVLLGDTGVGKSGLALVLSQQGFHPTESTHGRRVHKMNARSIEAGHAQGIRREIYLGISRGNPDTE